METRNRWRVLGLKKRKSVDPRGTWLLAGMMAWMPGCILSLDNSSDPSGPKSGAKEPRPNQGTSTAPGIGSKPTTGMSSSSGSGSQPGVDTQTGAGPNSLLLAVVQDPKFSQLTRAIARAGFESELTHAFGQRTFLAPNNAAFDRLPPAEKAALMDNPKRLLELLRHHVMEGRTSVDQLSGGIRRSLAGYPIIGRSSPDAGPFMQSGGTRQAQIISGDRSAKNGVFHEVSELLAIPEQSILELAQGRSELSSFFAAASASSLEAQLRNPGHLTVFAPNNQGFSDLSDRIGAQAYADLLKNQSEISRVLRQHLHGELFASDKILEGKDIGSLEPGKAIRCRWNKGVATVNGRQVEGGSQTDLIAKNGVLHIVRGTLHDGT